MTAYYNEIDKEACAVLLELIAAGIIAPGEVDNRSIKDVIANDLRGFDQCHFFAGAGLWSVSARLAGWPDDKPLWSASCPCQPFSAAGKQAGTDDPRHLWPDLYRIIRAWRGSGRALPILVGEQVAGAAGYGWFDGVRADLAKEGIAARTVDIPACAVDAPHERNRQWWVAVADTALESIEGRPGSWQRDGQPSDVGSDGRGSLADTESVGSRRDEQERRQGERAADGWTYAAGHVADADRLGRGERGRAQAGDQGARGDIADGRDAGEAGTGPLGDAVGARLEGQRGHVDRGAGWPQQNRSAAATDGGDGPGNVAHAAGAGHPEEFGSARDDRSPAGSGEAARAERADRSRNGSWWADAEWIRCHDNKARRAKPGIPMLVDGMVGRNGLWRLAGNSIVPQLAAEVLASILDVESMSHG